MSHATAIDMAIRDFQSDSLKELSDRQKKRNRRNRTIDLLYQRVRVEHERN
ncbi:hypothetical protein [Synechococcus sp. PCC 7336]|uniref:hypothetical protein n=1 Tax=Synechococcus sp. PCC 7336 TaxID=195250 RepID=UPI00034DF8BC|nr:hypothetical protein [Synechococcus sp. PCC 7336]